MSYQFKEIPPAYLVYLQTGMRCAAFVTDLLRRSVSQKATTSSTTSHPPDFNHVRAIGQTLPSHIAPVAPCTPPSLAHSMLSTLGHFIAKVIFGVGLEPSVHLNALLCLQTFTGWRPQFFEESGTPEVAFLAAFFLTARHMWDEPGIEKCVWAVDRHIPWNEVARMAETIRSEFSMRTLVIPPHSYQTFEVWLGEQYPNADLSRPTPVYDFMLLPTPSRPQVLNLESGADGTLVDITRCMGLPPTGTAISHQLYARAIGSGWETWEILHRLPRRI